MNAHNRALAMSLAAFVVFSAIVVAIFMALDVRMLFVIGPVVVVAIASFGVYRAAVRGSAPQA